MRPATLIRFVPRKQNIIFAWQPFYLRTARTSFRSPKPLPQLLKDISGALEAKNIEVEVENAAEPCRLSCSAVRLLSVVAFEIRVFTCDAGPGGKHLVEMRGLSGCRYAFSDLAADLASHLKVSYVGATGKPKAAAFCPPAFPADAAAVLDMPSLKLASSDVKPPAAPAETPGTPEDEACTAIHVAALLVAGADEESLVAGCRACGSLAAELEACMKSCAHHGKCGANHHGHHFLFASGGPWVGLASRVAELAKVGEGEVRIVAMAAVANVAALEHVCVDWLAAAVTTVADGAAVDGSDSSADALVRREALRAAEALAQRDPGLAAALAKSDGGAFIDVLQDAVAAGSVSAANTLAACTRA